MKIHHATTKRANKYGLTIAEDEGNFIVSYGDHVLATDTDPKAAVRAATDHIDTNGYPKDGESKDKRSVIKEDYRPIYAQFDDSCGDEVAQWLKSFTTNGDGSLDEDRLDKIAGQAGVVQGKYDHLNPGHKRMCIGNVIRARVKRGELEMLASGRIKELEPAE